MSKIFVSESSMNFVVDDERTFLIEDNGYIKTINGFKPCEFVVWSDAFVRFVEAKTTFSNPQNCLENFQENVREISDKFKCSMQLFIATQIGRFKSTGKIVLPESANTIDWSNVKIEFYIVIKEHKKEWLIPVSDAIKKAMRQMIKCWNISDCDIKVINEKIALSRGLIEN